MVCLVLVMSFLVGCGTPVATPGPREELQSVSLVVTNGIVVDGTGTSPIADGLVAIHSNRIVAVGQSTDFKIPAEATVIDAGGGTILPGVINAHAHNVHTAATRRHLFLLDGVTSVCDLAIPLSLMEELEQEESQSGLAARGFKAGPIVTAPGGYPGPYHGLSISYEIQGAEQAEMAVRDLHARGADYIKVALEPGSASEPWPVMILQELRSIVTTAHAHDLLVRAHVTNSDMLDIAIHAGVDVVEHVPMPPGSYENLEEMLDDAGNFRIPSKLESQMVRMIDQDVVLVPTLDVIIDDTFLRRAVASEPELFIQAVLSVVRFYNDAGGLIAVGNDYGNPGVQPGMPLREMKLLHSAGLSPLEVIQAATKHAAYVCGQSDKLGTLEIGKLADLIVVDGNPLDDLIAMGSVLFVVKEGEVALSPEEEAK